MSIQMQRGQSISLSTQRVQPLVRMSVGDVTLHNRKLEILDPRRVHVAIVG